MNKWKENGVCVLLLGCLLFSYTNPALAVELDETAIVETEDIFVEHYDTLTEKEMDSTEDAATEESVILGSEDVIIEDFSDEDILIDDTSIDLHDQETEQNDLGVADEVIADAEDSMMLMSASDDKGEGWSYDADTKTLTLENYTGTEVEDIEGESAQIYAEGDLNLVLKGDNTLSAISDYGIYCEGNLTINGDGNLSIVNVGTGIYARRDIVFSSAEVTSNDSTHGLYSGWGTITINSGMITVSNDINDINGTMVTVNDGNVNAKSINGTNITIKKGNIKSAITGSKNITIDGGEINIDGGCITCSGILNIGSPNINITNGHIYTGQISKITGGSIYVNRSDDYGLHVNGGTLTIAGGDIYLDGGLFAYDFEMSGGVLETVGYLSSYNIDIKDGTITVNDGAIDGYDTVTISGGCVTAENASDFAIGSNCAQTRVTITGGEVNATGKYAIGMIYESSTYAGSFYMSGGTLHAEGSVYGIVEETESSYNGTIEIVGGEAYISGGIQALRAVNEINFGNCVNICTGKNPDNKESASAYYGEKYIETKVNHEYVTVTNKATVSKDGSIVTKCSKCGQIESEESIYYPKIITLSETSYAYNGNVQKPTVLVKGSDGKTILSSNYSVTYPSGCKDIGSYIVTIEFKGNYSGSTSQIYKILPAIIEGVQTSNTTSGVIISWVKSTQATGYQVYRNTNGGDYSKVATISNIDTVTYSDAEANTNGVKYQYKVRAYKTVGGITYYGAFSAENTIYYLTTPVISATSNPTSDVVVNPEKITITKKPTVKKISATKNKITVKWSHFKHTSRKTNAIWKKIKKVQVQCAVDKAFKKIVQTAMVKKNKTKAVIKGLKKNNIYYVRVRYCDGTGYSKWSKVKKIKTKKN